MTTRQYNRVWLLGVVVLLGACGPGALEDGRGDAKGKADTGWIGDTSFEVGGTLEATAVHAAKGEWEKLASDRALQERLVDIQRLRRCWRAGERLAAVNRRP